MKMIVAQPIKLSDFTISNCHLISSFGFDFGFAHGKIGITKSLTVSLWRDIESLFKSKYTDKADKL